MTRDPFKVIQNAIGHISLTGDSDAHTLLSCAEFDAVDDGTRISQFLLILNDENGSKKARRSED